ncbi:MAG: hypothetical protein E5X68_32370, partial [Mesorhizobium sp.]
MPIPNAEEPPPLLHPNMAEIYRQRIAALHESLQAAPRPGRDPSVRGKQENPDVLSEAGGLDALLSQDRWVETGFCFSVPVCGLRVLGGRSCGLRLPAVGAKNKRARARRAVCPSREMGDSSFRIDGLHF